VGWGVVGFADYTAWAPPYEEEDVMELPRVELPEGIPTYTSSHMTGRFVAARGYLPVTIFFEDWDVYWVKGGAGAFVLGTGHRVEIRKGDFLLLPPLVSARVEETPGAGVLEFHFCHFDFRAVRRGREEWDGGDCRGPGGRSRVPVRFGEEEAPGVVKAYERLIAVQEEVRAGGGTQFWQIEVAVIGLIGEVAAFGMKEHAGPVIVPRVPGAGMGVGASVADGRILKLLSRIDAEPARGWRVDELAREVGMTAGHLHALCIKVLGKGIKQHIIDARLRLAVRLLRPAPTGMTRSIKEVSRLAGFSSQHYLARLFKKKYRITAREFQRSGGEI
jgi:AraC-like DNA-binding protein